MRTATVTLFSFNELSPEAQATALECERYRQEGNIQRKINSFIDETFAQFGFKYDEASFDLGTGLIFTWKLQEADMINFAAKLLDPADALSLSQICEHLDFEIVTKEHGPGLHVISKTTPAQGDVEIFSLFYNRLQAKLDRLLQAINATLRVDAPKLYSDDAMQTSILDSGAEFIFTGQPWSHGLEVQP